MLRFARNLTKLTHKTKANSHADMEALKAQYEHYKEDTLHELKRCTDNPAISKAIEDELATIDLHINFEITPSPTSLRLS